MYDDIDLISGLLITSFAMEDFSGPNSPEAREVLGQEFPNECFTNQASSQSMMKRSRCLAFGFESSLNTVEVRPKECQWLISFQL